MREPFAGPGDEILCGGLPFRTLVDQHWDAVYRLLFHMTSDLHDAEDLAQETFLRALRGRESFREGTNARAWLMRIATNALFDLRRRRKTARTRTLDPTDLERLPAATGHDDDEVRSAVAAALAELNETQRTVFLLRVDEDRSFEEIAQAMKIRPATARWHLMQARRSLVTRLKGRV